MTSIYTKVAYYSGSENYSDVEFSNLFNWMSVNVGQIYKDWAYRAADEIVEIVLFNKQELAPMVALRWS